MESAPHHLTHRVGTRLAYWNPPTGWFEYAKRVPTPVPMLMPRCPQPAADPSRDFPLLAVIER